jgi:cytochrome P450
LVIANYNRIINKHMVPQLEQRYADYMSFPIEKRSDSIFTLMLDALNTNLPSPLSNLLAPQMKKAFKDIVLYQIRMLLVAGHDTTTIILVYAYHILHKNPSALQKMREEHTGGFGPNLSRISALLHEKPALINNLPYTLGVIKEIMRIPPPGGAYRAGSPEVHLLDKNGTQYPTAGCHVSVAHHTLHYSPNVYSNPELFQPERWIDKGVKLGGWRPFERGPRNCMGQDVAMLQLKVVLVLTGRKFKITPAYEEWDELQVKKNSGSNWSIAKLIGDTKRFEKNEVNGDRAYQAENGGARPALGYPYRVELVDG